MTKVLILQLFVLMEKLEQVGKSNISKLSILNISSGEVRPLTNPPDAVISGELFARLHHSSQNRQTR